MLSENGNSTSGPQTEQSFAATTTTKGIVFTSCTADSSAPDVISRHRSVQATHFCRLPRERKVVSHKLITFEDKNYNDKSSLLHLVNYRHHLQRTNC